MSVLTCPYLVIKDFMMNYSMCWGLLREGWEWLIYMYSKFDICTFNLLNASMAYLSIPLNIELIQARWCGKIVGRVIF